MKSAGAGIQEDMAAAKKMAFSFDGDTLVALDDLSNRFRVTRSEMSRRIVSQCASPSGVARLQQFYRDYGSEIDFRGGFPHVVVFYWSSDVSQSLEEASSALRSSVISRISKSETFRMMILLHAVEANVVKLEPIQRWKLKRIPPCLIDGDFDHKAQESL